MKGYIYGINQVVNENDTWEINEYAYTLYIYIVWILDEVICISHSANTIGKNMNPTILPPGIDK